MYLVDSENSLRYASARSIFPSANSNFDSHLLYIDMKSFKNIFN